MIPHAMISSWHAVHLPNTAQNVQQRHHSMLNALLMIGQMVLNRVHVTWIVLALCQ